MKASANRLSDALYALTRQTNAASSPPRKRSMRSASAERISAAGAMSKSYGPTLQAHDSGMPGSERLELHSVFHALIQSRAYQAPISPSGGTLLSRTAPGSNRLRLIPGEPRGRRSASRHADSGGAGENRAAPRGWY